VGNVRRQRQRRARARLPAHPHDEQLTTAPWLRSALTIGFLGAYTTFSTLQYETYRLLEDGALGLAAANVFGSAAAGLFAVYLGVVAGRAL
jgi:fluoride ion exporter CrcB/FEX